MAILQRVLTGIEDRAGAPILFSTKYEGAIDKEALEFSLRVLFLSHPVLFGKVGIDPDSRRKCLYVTPENGPTISLDFYDDESHFREASKKWDPRVAVCQISLHEGTDEGLLSFRFDHSIADGVGCLEILRNFWSVYANTVARRPFSIGLELALPRSPSVLLRERWNLHSVDNANKSEEQNVQETHFHRKSEHFRRIRLGVTDTLALHRASHGLGASLHGVIAGSLLKAIHRQSSSSARVRYACVSPIDLRKHVAPTVGPTETTNFAVNHIATVDLEPHSNAVDIGNRIKEQIDFAIRNRLRVSGDFVVNGLSKPSDVASSFKDRRGIWITNLGRIERLAETIDIKVTDLRFTVIPGIYSAYTYNDRLSVECDFSPYVGRLFTGSEVAKLCEEFDEILHEIAADFYR